MEKMLLEFAVWLACMNLCLGCRYLLWRMRAPDWLANVLGVAVPLLLISLLLFLDTNALNDAPGNWSFLAWVFGVLPYLVPFLIFCIMALDVLWSRYGKRL